MFQDNLLFAKSIHEELAEELIRVSYSIFVRRNASRLIQFKPDAENEKVNLVYLNRNDETIVSTLVKVDLANLMYE